MSQVETDQHAKHHEVVAFRVAEQDFCFDIMSVREIRGWTETTTLPHAQSYVKGVINLRGSVVPVVDLSDRLGFGPTQACARHVIIITVVEGQTIGLLADVVSDILAVSDDSMHPVPDMVSDQVKSFISGVVLIDERMIRRLDLSSVVPKTTLEAA
ncbi:chemotaxis protein CheW [Jannaschia sp. CCS1]|uniref:chemotaxis protein CheW n=1 Tax=Jannaschia sp. (strain CCS1) TaxID=290400 RepID=UPI000053AA88|nr:chemotaxis protein CheW [Jannaschia sp. CCS1]ABD55757.1 CheW protein [Jannaschia sp. CCS1]